MKNFKSPLLKLRKIIRERGGFVNSHSHLDRAYTLRPEDFSLDVNKQLKEKWKVIDDLKRNTSTEQYYDNIKSAILCQSFFEVQSILSFVDVDSVCEYRPLLAAQKGKEYALTHGIDLKIACQTLKGVLDKTERKYIEGSLDKIDIIGSLPAADAKLEGHFDIIMNIAKSTGKRVHSHVDQLNTIDEKETELLARKTIEYGLQGRVTAVHSISLACHPKKYRKYVYDLCKDAGISFISCPTAWIDSRRNERLSVTHNSVTPVDELVENGILVALGTDNIHDVYKPYSDGDMFVELRFLLESTHFYDINALADIATTNGKYVMGLYDE